MMATSMGGGVAVLISRVILLAEMSDHDKALTICGTSRLRASRRTKA